MASALGVAAMACGDPPPPPLDLAPLGEHVAHVGQTLLLPLAPLAPEEAGLRWTLLQGPGGMGLLGDGEAARLVWVPDAFDLGPSKPGAGRVPGPARAIVVRARTPAGAEAKSEGSVSVVPVDLAGEIDVRPTLWLSLSERRTGRWPVSTASTALGAMPVELGEDAPKGAELLAQGPGRFTLRYRPTDETIARTDRVLLALHAPDRREPVSTRWVTIRLLGRPPAPPCGGEAPAVQVDLQPTSGPAGGTLRLRALDDRAGPLRFRVTAAAPGSASPPPTAWGHLPPGGAHVSLPPPPEGSLQAVRVEVRDLDDPLLSRCDRVGRWPAWGPALVGAGPGCADDADQPHEPVEAAPPELTPGAEGGLDRRLCSGRTDGLRLLQPAGTAMVVLARSPQTWPDHALRVLTPGGVLCAAAGQMTSCRVPAGAGGRALRVELSSAAPTSVTVRAMPVAGHCRLGPAPPVLLEPGATRDLALCPLGSQTLHVALPPSGRRWLRWRHAGGRIAVEALAGGAVVGRWRDLGGELLAALSGPPGQLQTVRILNLSALDLNTTVRDLPSPPQPAAPPAWLPSLQPLHLRLWPGAEGTFGLAGNGTRTAIGVALGGAPAGEISIDVADPAALPVLSAPWPDPGGKGAPLSHPTAGVEAGPGETAALRISRAGTGALDVALLPMPATATGCAPDRYAALDPKGVGPVALAFPANGALVLSDLRECSGDSRRFDVQVQADDLLEVAISSTVAPPPMRVIGPSGRVCVGQAPQGIGPGWQAAPHLPPRRDVASCWVQAAGTASILVGPATQPSRYDLAVRRR